MLVREVVDKERMWFGIREEVDEGNAILELEADNSLVTSDALILTDPTCHFNVKCEWIVDIAAAVLDIFVYLISNTKNFHIVAFTYYRYTFSKILFGCLSLLAIFKHKNFV